LLSDPSAPTENVTFQATAILGCAVILIFIGVPDSTSPKLENLTDFSVVDGLYTTSLNGLPFTDKVNVI